MIQAFSPMPGSRSHALDGLRGASAQAVFCAHLAVTTIGGLAEGASLALGVLARLAVVVFFVLSGFVIASSIIQRSRSGRFDLWGFTASRMARIYPPYLMAVALCFCLGWLARHGAIALPAPLQGWPIDLSAAALARAVAFLYLQHDLMTRLDGPLWSLRLEVWLYVIAAGLAVAWTWQGLWRVAGAAVALLLAAAMLKGLYGAGLALIAFGLGAAGAWRRAAPARWTEPAALAGLAAAALVLAGDHAFAVGRPLSLFVEAGAAALTALWVTELAAGRGRLHGPLARLKPLGGFAYTLYIAHMPLLYVAAAAFPATGTANLPVAAAAFVGIQAFAAASAAVLENHAGLMRALRSLSLRPAP